MSEARRFRAKPWPNRLNPAITIKWVKEGVLDDGGRELVADK
jgi:hypothetical protein